MFLSSSTFNRIDAACLSRMVQWEPCHPVPLSKRPSLVSHLKTIARVLGPAPEGGATSRGRRPWYQTRNIEANHVFSWVMMTSACLSRGAQGDSIDRVTTSSKGDETVSYANFELGVLFCSRLQNQPTDRLYCWRENTCTCNARAKERRAKSTETSRFAHYRRTTGTEGPRMIPLPFPYRFDAAKYQQCEDELEFAETPYFHEIIPSDCHVGNMRMTPFGEYIANKLGDE
jgi:Tyrosyl-DNA phosphodiesterase